MGIILVFISQALQTDLPAGLAEHAQCQTRDSNTNSSLPCSASFYNSNSTVSSNDVTPKDFGHGLLFWLVLLFMLFVLLVLAFHPKYRRVNAERKAKFEESVYIQSRE